MKRFQILFVLCLLSVALAPNLFAQKQKLTAAERAAKALENAIDGVSQSAHSIAVYNNDNQPFKMMTGLALAADGVIATSASAISNATWIGVTIDGKERFATEVALVDTVIDVALIRVKTDSKLTPLNLSRIGSVTPNQPVYEMSGDAKGVLYSEAKGDKSQKIGKLMVAKSTISLAENQNGGALLDSKGRFVGMISKKLGGALPAANLRPLVRKLKKVKEPVKLLAQEKPVLGPEIKKTFYASGKLQSERTYLKDKLDGVSKFYTEDGKLGIEEMYKNNLREGYSREFFPSGKPRTEANYRAGKKNGAFKTFYEDGNVESEATYENDLVVGVMKLFAYYASGALKEESFANTEGQLIGKKRWFYENGMLAIEENYENGLREGIRRTYYDNGFLEKAQTWKGGNQVGDERVYFANGKVKEDNKFNDAGVMVQSKIYDERGKKIEDLDAEEIVERSKRKSEKS